MAAARVVAARVAAARVVATVAEVKVEAVTAAEATAQVGPDLVAEEVQEMAEAAVKEVAAWAMAVAVAAGLARMPRHGQPVTRRATT